MKSRTIYFLCNFICCGWGLCLILFSSFSGEGPRSRRYGRTAAMRLIVQPYDEDEEDDYFLSFS
jgi:hypothetical protein